MKSEGGEMYTCIPPSHCQLLGCLPVSSLSLGWCNKPTVLTCGKIIRCMSLQQLIQVAQGPGQPFCKDENSKLPISIQLLRATYIIRKTMNIPYLLRITDPHPPSPRSHPGRNLHRDAIGQVEGKEAETIFLTSGYCGFCGWLRHPPVESS